MARPPGDNKRVSLSSNDRSQLKPDSSPEPWSCKKSRNSPSSTFHNRRHPDQDQHEIQHATDTGISSEYELDQLDFSEDDTLLDSYTNREESLKGAPTTRSTQERTRFGNSERRITEPDQFFPDTIVGKSQQLFYIAEEDTSISITGLQCKQLRVLFYRILCVLSLGVAYIILRWLPLWKVYFTARPSPLCACDWVLIQNQWGEVTLLPVEVTKYTEDANPVLAARAQTHQEFSGSVAPKVLRTFAYRHYYFAYCPQKDVFLTNLNWVDTSWATIDQVSKGLDGTTQEDRFKIFGRNSLDIDEKPNLELLMEEVLHPFYIFQVFSVILWSFEQYYYYASCILVVSIASITNTLMETKKATYKMRQLVQCDLILRVLRDGIWTSVHSSSLVPGDVYDISSIDIFPCDSVLLSGDCIANESMLTGESVPVSKSAATDLGLGSINTSLKKGLAIPPDVKKHYLYAGTKPVQVRCFENSSTTDTGVCIALVVRTGFRTAKGGLVRSMLFPKPINFKYYQDSFKYIGVMAVIAFIGFLFSCIQFVHLRMEFKLIIIRALDLITIVIPPALPATLTIATNFALSRLRKKLIHCISPSRVNVCGKVDIVCFDKTGTLTEEGLDILGVRLCEPSSTGKSRFSVFFSDKGHFVPKTRNFESTTVTSSNAGSLLQGLMATCHSLRKIDNQLVGDPLEVKMVEFSNWSYSESHESTGFNNNGFNTFAAVASSSDSQKRLGIVRAFEFSSTLRRMSVLVKEPNSNYMHIFLKGAPEAIFQVCEPSSIPLDYKEQLHGFVHKGYRVIACAAKIYKGMTISQAKSFQRTQAESGLTFLGFIVFENKLKASTTAVINKLNEANLRTVMCTGDNVLTAISVARECQMVEDSTIYVPHFFGKLELFPLMRQTANWSRC